MGTSKFVISLDFELHWGVRSRRSVADYRENLLGVREAIPTMLSLFAKREIAATWATVGFVFAETKKELEAAFPTALPSYDDAALSPYEAMSGVGTDERSDPFHFGASLIRKIAATAKQEIATHTFSHYYCLAPGQRLEQFEADLEAASSIARSVTDSLESIAFPRNQFSEEHLRVIERRGYVAYRGSRPHWAYEPSVRETKWRRAFRFADAHIPLTSPHSSADGRSLTNVAASMFLRPYSRNLRCFAPLRGWRIREVMRTIAETGGTFHLWWHPHNFGVNLRENMRFLESVLDDYGDVRRRFGMESVTMADAA